MTTTYRIDMEECICIENDKDDPSFFFRYTPFCHCYVRKLNVLKRLDEIRVEQSLLIRSFLLARYVGYQPNSI